MPLKEVSFLHSNSIQSEIALLHSQSEGTWHRLSEIICHPTCYSTKGLPTECLPSPETALQFYCQDTECLSLSHIFRPLWTSFLCHSFEANMVASGSVRIKF